MEVLVFQCLSVVGIHYIYQGYLRYLKRTRKQLGQRVAYMLWVASQQARAERGA